MLNGCEDGAVRADNRNVSHRGKTIFTFKNKSLLLALMVPRRIQLNVPLHKRLFIVEKGSSD